MSDSAVLKCSRSICVNACTCSYLTDVCLTQMLPHLCSPYVRDVVPQYLPKCYVYGRRISLFCVNARQFLLLSNFLSKFCPHVLSCYLELDSVLPLFPPSNREECIRCHQSRYGFFFPFYVSTSWSSIEHSIRDPSCTRLDTVRSGVPRFQHLCSPVLSLAMYVLVSRGCNRSYQTRDMIITSGS